jgi:aminomethyltransferase
MGLKRTALYEEHVRLGGRLIDFGGWELPVQYSGLMDEHLACRSAAGLFDVSHMGEVIVEGTGAEAFVNFLITNDVRKMAVGQAMYSAMCFEHGGIVDDLVVYKRGQDRFFIVINASNTEKDVKWMKEKLKEFGASHTAPRLEDVSAKYTQIAIQGPKAAEILQKLTQTDLKPIGTYRFAEGKVCGGIEAILARTGYTGEDGFEVYVPWEQGPKVWRALIEAGQPLGLKPVGLGARDTLRMEMKYPLYGNELSDETNSLEAGLGWVTKFDKGEFVGREALLKVKQHGVTRKLVGLKMLDRGIPRHGYELWDETGNRRVGVVTSGTQSPSLKQAIAVGYVEKALGEVGTQVTVDIRGQKLRAEVVPTPFYKRPY